MFLSFGLVRGYSTKLQGIVRQYPAEVLRMATPVNEFINEQGSGETLNAATKTAFFCSALDFNYVWLKSICVVAVNLSVFAGY